jgi:hypothetical protein
MMNKTILLVLVAIFYSVCAFAQPDHPVANHQTYQIAERLEVLSGQNAAWHSAIRAWNRKDLAQLASHADSSKASVIYQLDSDIAYIYNENNEWITDSTRIPERITSGWRRLFYPTKANLWEVNHPHFKLRINPILAVGVGRESGDSTWLFANRRGVEVRGNIDNKIWFYTNLIEQQVRFPEYTRDRIEKYKAIPGASLYKVFNSTIFNSTNVDDYNVAQAYIGFNATKHIGIQLGHGNHFIGNGSRSLLLSDFGTNNFYLKINTRVWRFHYQNLFMELTPFSKGYFPRNDGLLPKKFVVAHYLDFKITPKTSIGIFETTVLARKDQFELQYLNPIIFYRSVDGFIGSPDNVLLGLNANTIIANRVRLYGQFILDEFKFSELYKPAQKGWWGNKYGYQLGAKYFNAFGVNHLDLLAEYNQVRPYTYSHGDSTISYSHYSQPLAHPLGANFREFIIHARYQPIPQLIFQGRVVRMRTGDDQGTNWGSNILLSYDTRPKEYGHEIGQGTPATTLIWRASASWQVWHNAFFDLNITKRTKDSNDSRLDRDDFIIQGGFRLNFWDQDFDF